MGRLNRFRRPLVALAALGVLAPLAACTDDGYGRGPSYGGQYAPPPPPPPPPGYYDDRGPDRRGGPPPQGYGDNRGPDGRGGPPPGYRDDREPYYAERDYRERQGEERALTRNDSVYRGGDGRYYCKRGDGTTGLIVGAALGGILGNVIDGGHNRVLGTLLGGGGGALLGKSVDEGQVRCR